MRATPLAFATYVVLLSACSDVQNPTESAPAPELSVSAEAAGPIVIKPGTSIQSKVNAYPAGTHFLIKAGRHRRQSVVPKSGNVFIGERGAILDGENATAHAFHMGDRPFPSNVRIKGLIMEHYNSKPQLGPVVAGRDRDRSASGWVVENCEIRYNAAAGIRMGHGMKILRNKIHHNGQIGLSGMGDNLLIEGNEIAYNNYRRRFDFGWELGGVKVARSRRAVLRNNYVHHNYGNGLWTDTDNIYVVFENNRVTDNAGAGIFHEISYDAVIRNNVVERNGFARGWMYGAGILIGHSPNVQVYGNTVRGNKQGIAGIQQSRGSGAYGPHLLKNLLVRDNRVTMSSGHTGVAQDMGSNLVFTSRNNRFRGNTYYLSGNGTPFMWMNGDRTPAQWRSYGHDQTATFNN